MGAEATRWGGGRGGDHTCSRGVHAPDGYLTREVDKELEKLDEARPPKEWGVFTYSVVCLTMTSNSSYTFRRQVVAGLTPCVAPLVKRGPSPAL